MRQMNRLVFEVAGDWTGSFVPLVRCGFTWPYWPGQSLREVLHQAGVPDEYIEDRLQTVFLNGKPADSLDLPLSGSEVRLTLSAAMPGLLGATLRRGGYYASMRDSISCQAASGKAAEPEDGAGPAGPSRLFIRLLNFTAPETGPSFLRQGVGLQAADLQETLAGLPEPFWQACRAVWAGQSRLKAEAAAVIDWLEARGEVVFQVVEAEASGS